MHLSWGAFLNFNNRMRFLRSAIATVEVTT